MPNLRCILSRAVARGIAEGNALAFDVLGGWLKKHFPLQG